MVQLHTHKDVHLSQNIPTDSTKGSSGCEYPGINPVIRLNDGGNVLLKHVP